MKEVIKNAFLKLFVNCRLLMWRFASAKHTRIKPLNEGFFIKKNTTCVVLGNGPSLKADIKNILLKKDVDFFCVNHFAESEHFSNLKPIHYALFDPYFWAADSHDKLKVKRDQLFNVLNNNVHWEMFLYIPRNANLSYLQKKITNPNIKLKQLQVVPISAVHYHKLPDIILEGKYGPPACNVIIYGVYLSIMAGYTLIELYGADLSFTEDVVVDQKNNQLLIEYRHFYGESSFEPLLANPQKLTPITMESLYRTTYLTFFAHNLLSKAAVLNATKITNKSSYSLIDSYERE